MSEATLSGSLDFASVGPWFTRADELSRQSSLSLAGVTHCDSAGLALLLELMRRARLAKHELRFTEAPTQLRELSAFFGLDSVFGF